MSSSYFQYISEKLRQLPGITHKRMFGGFGFFKNGIMFGLYSGEVLYFKADQFNQNEFESRGSTQFVYQVKGKDRFLPYWTLPEEILEDIEKLSFWIDSSYLAGLRKKKQ